jgi:hypothetical protein
VLEVARGADHGDAAVAYGDGGVFQNAGVAHLFALSRSRRTGASDDLGCVNEEEAAQDSVIEDFCGVRNLLTATYDYRPGETAN